MNRSRIVRRRTERTRARPGTRVCRLLQSHTCHDHDTESPNLFHSNAPSRAERSFIRPHSALKEKSLTQGGSGLGAGTEIQSRDAKVPPTLQISSSSPGERRAVTIRLSP